MWKFPSSTMISLNGGVFSMNGGMGLDPLYSHFINHKKPLNIPIINHKKTLNIPIINHKKNSYIPIINHTNPLYSNH